MPRQSLVVKASAPAAAFGPQYAYHPHLLFIIKISYYGKIKVSKFSLSSPTISCWYITPLDTLDFLNIDSSTLGYSLPSMKSR